MVGYKRGSRKNIKLTDIKNIEALCVNHSGTEFIIITKKEYDGYRIDSIKYFSLQEQKYLWGYSWDWEGTENIKIAFSNDNKRIILVSSYRIIIINSENGKLMSNKTEFQVDFSRKGIIRKVLSNNGQYLVFWQQKPGYEYEGWFTNFLKWISGIKEPLKMVRVWDIYNNKLLYEVERQNSNNGAACFTSDNQNFLIGKYNNSFNRLYSIMDSIKVKEWRAEIPSQIEDSYDPDYFLISPGNKYFCSNFLDNIIIWELESKNIVYYFDRLFDKKNVLSTVPGYYPMVFSENGKSFIFQNGANLDIYDTGTWEKKLSFNWVNNN